VKTHETEERITISCRIIYLFFKEILMLANTARTKRIPSMFLKLPKHKLSNLLAAYFSGVRGLEINDHSINCSSFSYELIKDIDTALLCFGIFSSISQHTRDNNVEYKLQLYGQDVLEFSDKINFTSERKSELLEKEIQLLKLKEIMKFKGNKLIPIQEIKLIQSEHEYVYSLNAEKFHTVLINENIVTHQCDGDEDAVILMLEGFLDFSKQFLPITRGGSMDAPLTLGLVLNPIEVDDESHAVDCMKRYPLEFYEQSFKFIDSKQISGIIDLIANRLDTPDQFENFHCTHETTDIATGPISTNYSRLGKMAEKLEAQLAVARLIRAAKMEDVAERVINKHFFPDMIGCLRAFGSQTFRCIRCNTKYRRLPLTGKCSVCIDGGKLLLTVHKKTVTKYFETTKKLIKEYNLSDYIKQRLELFDESINEYFILEENNQTSLTEFFGKPD
ncbi:MAG: LAGLIDADG family homing endonuclease, partial [Candidatus Heimdallarchaeota archaeon]